MTRIKPKSLVIGTIDEADAALLELAGINRDVALIEANMNERIEEARSEAACSTKPFRDRADELAKALEAFAVIRRAELFEGDKKSRELVHGTIGFRLSTSLKLAAKQTMAGVLERLKDLGLREGIRQKEEVNKDVLRDWPEEKLALVGMKRDQKDLFFCEPKAEELPKEAA
jgi:phage host-nuclease inhibitor protein Gam